MRVGYDIRLLVGSAHPTGIGRYALSLISAMRRLATVELFSDQLTHLPPELDGLAVHVLPKRPLWQQTVLPAALMRQHVDVFHGLAYTIPAWTHCPTVVTIHDMGFKTARETLAPDVLSYLSRSVPLAVRHAAGIIVPSQAVGNDIIRSFPRQTQKVHVIHHGVSTAFLDAGRANDKDILRAQLGEDRPYVLAVGTQEPRKNLVRLVREFMNVSFTEGLPHRLVLVGAEGAATAQIDEMRKTVPELVRRIGYLPDRRLIQYYQGSDALVYPSLFEGFGLPLLEAMATGCPVVTSMRPCMPEIAGEAAIYIDPRSAASFRQGLKHILQNPDVGIRLQQEGFERVRHFSWQHVAERTFELYQRVLYR